MIKQGITWITMMVLTLLLTACGVDKSSAVVKSSAVEGKLVDEHGQPLPNVKITATHVKSIEGYYQFEAMTKSDGTFRINGLYPSSRYILQPRSDKWKTYRSDVQLDSAPSGETVVLSEPMMVKDAYSSNNGSLVLDLITGVTWFNVSSDGVLTNSITGQEWVVGPDRDFDYTEAMSWIAGCNVAGGGWRMPTLEEMETLRWVGVGEYNRDPNFEITDDWVWIEQFDPTEDEKLFWVFFFGTYHGGLWGVDLDTVGARVFEVRGLLE
ncbi:MAG: carboxypeptidase regulatory-like domain-containing protein [bacterium]